MFRWTDDMVRFMRDAAGFGSYQTELAGWICSQIPQARHVCDAGCGLGFLALQLAQRYPRVTAADISEQALDIAHAQAEEKRVSNLEIVQTDLLAYAPETRFDAMVFCLFGKMPEILPIAKRCCAGRIVVIKKAFTHHRFSMSRVPLRDEVTDRAADFLRERACGFRWKHASLKWGSRYEAFAMRCGFLKFTARTRPARSRARRCAQDSLRRATRSSRITCRRKKRSGALPSTQRIFRRKFYERTL